MNQEAHEHRPWLGTCVRCEGVEQTNNAGERALRHAVIWRKLSVGAHSEAGGRFIENTLTVIDTRRPQHRRAIGYLSAGAPGHLAGQPPPSLLHAVWPVTTTRKAAVAAWMG